MAAPGLIDGVQKLVAQNVQKATKAASVSTSKIWTSLTTANFSPIQLKPNNGSPKKKNKFEELEDIFENDSAGISSLVAAGSTDVSVAPASQPKQLLQLSNATAEAQKSVKMTRSKLLQIEKEAIATRAASLFKLLNQSKSLSASTAVCNDIASHLADHPEAVEFYGKHGVVPLLLKIVTRGQHKSVQDKRVGAARRCLALMGHTLPPKGQGVSILSLDGGGMRGLALLEVLKQLERSLDRPLHECFDYVMGVSTGGIVALLVFMMKTSVEDCEKLYLELGSQVFSRAAVVGTSQLLINQAFYDSKLWEEILKDQTEGTSFSDFAGDPAVPKVALLSAATTDTFLKPFLFRNYNIASSAMAESSTYPRLSGSAKYKLWQGCRASSAAPFYYEQFKLDGVAYTDGGMLANNPTAYALHEASALWPNEVTKCVVSVGTGRPANTWLPMIPSNMSSPTIGKSNNEYEHIADKSLNDIAKSPSLRQKIDSFVQQATDTEITHSILAGTMPKDTYFRLNPFLSEIVDLDEYRPEYLAKLQSDAKRYAELNEVKFNTVSKMLSKPRSHTQLLIDEAKTRYMAYTPTVAASVSSMKEHINMAKLKLKMKSLSLYGAASAIPKTNTISFSSTELFKRLYKN